MIFLSRHADEISRTSSVLAIQKYGKSCASDAGFSTSYMRIIQAIESGTCSIGLPQDADDASLLKMVRSERGSNSRPSACEADVITTTPSDLCGAVWALIAFQERLGSQF